MNSKSALRVAAIWCGSVLDEHLLRPGEALRVGGDRDARFLLPFPAEGSIELLRPQGETWELVMPPGVTGFIEGAGGRRTLGDAPRSIMLGRTDWGILHRGDITIFLQWVHPEDIDFAGTPLRLIDYNLLSSTLAAAALHLLLLLLGFLLWSPVPQPDARGLPERIVSVIVDGPPDLDEPVDEPEPDERGEVAEAGDAPAESDVTEPHPEPSPVDERERAPRSELASALDQALAADSFLTSILSADDAFAGDISSEFITAGSGDEGDSRAGLGLGGTRPGGGGDGFGDVRGVGELDGRGGRSEGARLGRRDARAPEARVRREPPTVSGFLSRERVERVVRLHARGIRACYERMLLEDDTLAGRITVQWTIGLDGRVVSRDIVENSTEHRGLESCLMAEVGRMRFDQPDGGMVTVSYPFTFRTVR